MKNLIKIICIIFILNINTTAQFIGDLGIETGYVNSNQTQSSKNINNETIKKAGFNIGLFVELYKIKEIIMRDKNRKEI